MNLRRCLHCLVLIAVLFSLFTSPQMTPPVSADNGGMALRFTGSSTDKQYVTFGNPPGLGLTTFTLEAWINRASGGVTMTTGSQGFDNQNGRPAGLYPVVSKGMGEGETPANINMNYILGITSTGVVGADFEDKVNGGNHPIWGSTVVSLNQWHHIAVTYGSGCWAVFLDGNAETMNGTTCPNATPESTSIQHAGLAAGLGSTGQLSGGFFAGTIDEARIWNRALNQSEIQANKTTESPAGSGLVARWSLNEGTGTTVSSSIGSFPGTITTAAALPTWVTGFPIPDLTPPAAPQNLAAAPGAGSVALTWTANPESDLAGYNIYRSSTSPVPITGTPLNGAVLLTSPVYTDMFCAGDTNTYHYTVVAVDTSSNKSVASAEASAAPGALPSGHCALQFNGSNQYVTFGQASGLGTQTFTLEAWVDRSAGGKLMGTGTGGLGDGVLPQAYPVLTKGRGQGESPANLNMNYWLGISAGGVIAADFEDTYNGLNHPILGSTAIPVGEWHHIAVTYGSGCWDLYLDGKLETIDTRTTRCPVTAATPPLPAVPESTSIQHAALATALQSAGTLPADSGFFAGKIDEARVWSVVRTKQEIQDAIDQELPSASNLLGRWSLNDGSGTTAVDSAGSSINGTLTNAPAWAAGAPLNLAFDTTPPASPTGLAATPGTGQIALVWDANTESDLAGYNIYRSTTSPVTKTTPLNTALLTSPAYTDSAVTLGTTYYYAVTAVDQSDNESALSAQVSAAPTPPDPGAYGLDLGSGSAYVALGDPARLHLSTFTIETWFKRTGTGTPNTTGSGGIPNAIPLVTHGSPESDGSNVDANWILAIDDTNDVIAADFEDMASGANHPVYGVTKITDNAWHHAAATYDGANWRLYLDGVLETTLAVNAAPRSDSIQRVGLGTMIESGGAVHGHFQGVLDEVRIWNTARTPAEIMGSLNNEIASAGGLVARYGFSEGYGSIAHDSTATPADGTITGSGSAWVAGAPFDISITAPAAPTNLTASANSASQINLAWTDASNNEASFELERSTTGASGPFTLLATLPVDTTAYNDTGLSFSSEYCYRLRATNPAGSSAYTSAVCATTQAEPNKALALGANRAYVTLGDTADLAQFTLEAWVRRDGPGVANTTGTDGKMLIPMITNGAAEAENAGADINYILGIQASDGALCADFEEAQTGAKPGQNHPVCGSTPLVTGDWYHVAATYDGSIWKLYLNGNLEATLDVGQPANTANTSQLAFGTGLKTDDTPLGFFDGTMDEVRIWSSARTQNQIVSTINTPITTPQTGLVGRWSMNEGAGTAVNGSAGTTINGAIQGTGYSWVAGAPFNISFTAPAAPTGLSAVSSGSVISLSWTDASNNEANFEIERSTTGIGGPYTLRNTVGVNTSFYTDSGLGYVTEYCYRVRATNFSGASGYSNAACATTGVESATALALGANKAYVTLGDTADLPQFTLESWVRRDGQGVSNTTGNGGKDLIPLISNGTADTETAAADINYFLGIQAADGVLCADFEEAQAGTTPGLNHPVCGATPLVTGTWYHVAATYDGSTWKLYLNGSLEASLFVGQPANTANTSQLAFGTGLKTDNTALGFFDGTMDEVRIWDSARTQTEIQNTINAQIRGPQTGLVARYGLNEGMGSTISSSAGTPINGTIQGTGYSWVAGAPFNLAFNHAPNVPTLGSPANGATNIPLSTTLSVNASDPENDSLVVTFYGRPVTSAGGSDFSIVALPDTQNYTTIAGGSTTFNAETQWVADNQASQNIVYTTHLGDMTEHGDNITNDSEWTIVDTAMSKLSVFGVVVGNHDITNGTTRFENHFGVARFSGKPYYGGHYGTDNANNYTLFSASGMNFIVLNLACTDITTPPPAAVLDWADALLKANLNRRGIVVCHTLFVSTSSVSTTGEAIVSALSNNPNLFLMLGGHVPGAGRATRTGTDGHAIQLVMSDYQSEPNGGNGWLRLMKFSPANNEVQVSTYSPTLGANKTDSANQFTFSYPMQGSSFTQIGTANVASGSVASVTWSGLDSGVQYEWYATVSDGKASTNSPTWTFTTSNLPTSPAIKTQPANLTVTAGQTASFNAAASGKPTPTVQWQVSTDGTTWANIAGATNTTYNFTALSVDNGKQYHAVFTNSEGSATSSAATLTVNFKPVVTTQPANQTVNAGQTAAFSAVANANPVPTVQWQVSTNGTTWTNITGAVSATYTFTAQAADDTRQYRAVFTNTIGSTNSTAATLTVNTAPAVITQPVSQTVTAGQAPAFSAVASGKPVPTVQWQVSTNGIAWTNITGATSATYTFTAQAVDDGKQYRAVFTNTLGTAATNAAVLTVNTPPAVTTHPASLTVTAGQTASFSAAATGKPVPTIQWQVSTNGTTWNDVPGAASITYSFTAQAADDGKQFRAVFTNQAGTATTNAAALTVITAPIITTQPADQIVNAGQDVSFSAAASGNPTPTMQWQVSANGTTWTDILGATHPSYTFTAQAADNGKKFRAIFTNNLGSASTNAAALTVTDVPVINTQPVNQTVKAGQTATFSASASSNPAPTVQWQVSTNGTTWTDISGATSATYTFIAQAADNGKQFRAVFTNSSGNVTTSAATLTVYHITIYLPVILNNP